MFAESEGTSLSNASTSFRGPPPGLTITCLFLAFWLAPLDVLAQTASDRITARALAEEGYDALKSQRFNIAEDRFRRADALEHAPTLVVDAGRALIGLGRFVEARERLELVLREGVSAEAPTVWKDALVDAAKLLEEVTPKIAWLTISAPNVANVQVKVDGQLIPQAAFDSRRATNPGTRKIEATADGHEPRQFTVDLAEGAQQTLPITLMRLEARVASNAEPAPVVARQVPVHSERSHPKLAYVVLGVGGLGIAVGAVTGFLALQKHSDLTSVCSNGACKPSAQSDIDMYHALGLASGLGFGLGLATAGTGFVLLQMRVPQSQTATALRLDMRLRVDPNLVGLEGTFQ